MTAPDTHALKHCTSCDTSLPADARFCVECGAAIGAPGPATARLTPQPYVSSAAANTRVMPRCPSCGVPNPAGAVYCVNCGTSIASGHTPLNYAPALATGGYSGTMVQNVYITNAVPPPIPLALRALWFLCVGLWFGPIWIVLGWLLNLTLIGMPLGLWMLNRTGHIMTLRRMTPPQFSTPVQTSANLAVRAVYFVLIGWWASLIWLMFGWLAAATMIGLPIAFLMFERTGTVMTLAEA